MVFLSAEASPKSLLPLTIHCMNRLFRADCRAECKVGGRTSGFANRTVSSLRATVPRALLASCKVSSSSKQKVSQDTYWESIELYHGNIGVRFYQLHI